jgi:hypothetical protein
MEMSIILPALAVAFAAVCVWLGVRIVNRRERWAKWTAVGLALLVAYPLSLAPACGIVSRCKPNYEGERRLPDIYTPIGWIWRYSENPGRNAIQTYASVFMARGRVVVLPIGNKSQTGIFGK